MCRADAYELQGGRFSGHAAVVAEGRELQVPGRLVTARFYVDAEDFVAEHCFYVLASHANYIPGESLTVSFVFPDRFWMLQLIHTQPLRSQFAHICMPALTIPHTAESIFVHTQCLLMLKFRCNIAWHRIVLASAEH